MKIIRETFWTNHGELSRNGHVKARAEFVTEQTNAKLIAYATVPPELRGTSPSAKFAFLYLGGIDQLQYE